MHKRSEISLELLGASGNNPFVTNTSSPRAVMDANHMSQALSLLRPTENLVKTGIEYEFGKYINDKKVRKDSVVRGVVTKSETLVEDSPRSCVFLEYEEDGKFYLDIEEVKTHESTHGFFGYETKVTKELKEAGYLGHLKEGTRLTRTRTLSDNGAYMPGITANTLLMSHTTAADDGILISESFAKRAGFLSVTKRIITIDNKKIPLLLYGQDEETGRFLPNVGEKVRPDGLLCAYREIDNSFNVFDMEDSNLHRYDPIFDIGQFVATNAEVVDIEVIKGVVDNIGLPPKLVEQLDRLSDELISYYRRITNTCRTITRSRRKSMANEDDYQLTPRATRLITDCEMILRAQSSNNTKLSYKKSMINGYRVIVTTKSEMTLNLGYKMTTYNADKGVVVRILPDSQMPRDEYGNIAEVVMDDTSTFSRMNPGRGYDSYMGALTRDNRLRVVQMVGDGINTEKQTRIIKFLRELYEMINPDMVRFLDSLNKEEQRQHVLSIVNDELYLYYPPDNEINITDVIDRVEASADHAVRRGSIIFPNADGEDVYTKKQTYMGRMYFLILEKVPYDFSAVSSSSVNNFGFPIKSTNQIDRYKTQHPISPTKTLGETEMRIFMSFADPELVIDLSDYNLNLRSHKLLNKEILNDDKPFSNQYGIDRRYNDYGQTKSLSILRHIFSGYGFDIKEKENPNGNNS